MKTRTKDPTDIPVGSPTNGVVFTPDGKDGLRHQRGLGHGVDDRCEEQDQEAHRHRLVPARGGGHAVSAVTAPTTRQELLRTLMQRFTGKDEIRNF
jgi:hypothetical protein